MRKRLSQGSNDIELKNEVAIPSNSVFVFTLDERFVPYNILSLTNLNNDNDTEVWINQSIKKILPAGNQRTFSGLMIRDVRIKNVGAGTIAINHIRGIIKNDGWIGRQIKDTRNSLLNMGMAVIRTIKALR